MCGVRRCTTNSRTTLVMEEAITATMCGPVACKAHSCCMVRCGLCTQLLCTHRPAVILEAGKQRSVNALQVGLDGCSLQLAHQLSQAVAGRLSASVVVCAGLGLIVLQHLNPTATEWAKCHNLTTWNGYKQGAAKQWQPASLPRSLLVRARAS